MARRRKGKAIHGWLVLDKPEGLTSTRAVSRVRRAYDAQKAGHAGTLDPLATGVLPIALGEATKTVPFIVDGAKQYRFAIKWGEATATDDREGDVTAKSDRRPSVSAIQAMLGQFIGQIDQVPPAFSAIKVDGQRAYDLAREGVCVTLAPRKVEIHDLTLIEAPDKDHGVFDMECGKGAYVRSLARDLARALGTEGHVAWLRRTRVGPFCLEDAIPLDKLEELSHIGAAFDTLLPVSTALDDIPALAVTGPEVQRLRHGQPIVLNRLQASQVCGEALAYASFGADAVALGQIKAGQFHPTRVFNLPLKGKIDVDYC